MPTFMKITKDKCINLDKLIQVELLCWNEKYVLFSMENDSSHYMEFKSKEEALYAINIIKKDFCIKEMEGKE